MIDPSKDNFTRPLSVKEILEELEISKDNYYRALSIQKRKILKRETNSYIVKNYYDVRLKAWQADMVIYSPFLICIRE